jgi:hypothetical protein
MSTSKPRKRQLFKTIVLEAHINNSLQKWNTAQINRVKVGLYSNVSNLGPKILPKTVKITYDCFLDATTRHIITHAVLGKISAAKAHGATGHGIRLKIPQVQNREDIIDDV